MNIKELKYQTFEYICYRIYQFHLQNKPEDIKKEFNIIRLTNLLFLISGINKENHLFDIFRFQGWFYGHMDPDIYNEYSKKDLIFKEEPIIDDPEIKRMVDSCIDKMIKEHPQTLLYNKWNLINLCKAHHSYVIYAVRLKRYYEDMDKEILINEPKYFK